LIVKVVGDYQIQDLISVATTTASVATASSTTSSISTSSTTAPVVTIASGLIVSISYSSDCSNIGNVTGNVDVGDGSTTFSWYCESRAVENKGLVPAEENNENSVKIPKAKSGDHGDDDCATHLEVFETVDW
jgi:hypothetical protein